MDNRRMRIAVLGAGISGLTISQLLKSDHDVTVYEAQPKIGGLIKCERVNDSLFHLIGGHVFNSKNQAVLDWFWSFFDQDKEFIKVKRNAKILFNGALIGYPIENHLYQLDLETLRKVLAELTAIFKGSNNVSVDYANFEHCLQKNFGPTLYQLYFRPYNEKIWQTDLSLVALDWLEGKLPMPKFEEIIYSNILRREEETMVHATFYYPKYNGSQFIADRLSEGLQIVVNNSCQDLKVENNNLFIGGKKFDKLVYTGDIRNLPPAIRQLLINNNIDWKDLLALRVNGTSNIFCETDDTDLSWLYIPQDFTLAHRIIYTGNFSTSNNKDSKRKTCVVEFSGHVSHKDMVSEIKKLPGNLSALASNYQPESYVVQDSKTRDLIRKVKHVLGRYNIYLTGRFAEWEYYNMDTAIAAAMSLKQHIM